ncbi:tRNA (5-methylaminomethyl-2-thiouridine)(34)-methyltransferase MnmD [Halobacteriovorax sp. ZH4_bin.1]|uniref:tRNA (5-methylaminomethyl-2-thiouridine)(34)-methyltransferase MnmD n=1 Tax=unclassified Halobacteriovorax TaxID=2639665 RepID=UPI003724B24B
MKFKTKLGEYQAVQTADGHLTLHSGLYDENCHSTAGAYEETLHNYVYGCDTINRANNSPIVILEIGLGVGLGVLATFNEAKNCQHKIKFISTEIDPELAQWVCRQNKFSDGEIIDEKISFNLSENFEVEILIGDARETIKNLILDDIKIDCIYQDAFSPTKNPSLWTKEWFRNLRSLCDNNSVMTTYSASVKIRKAMLDAGFHVTSMKGFANKRTATRAFTNGQYKDEKLEGELARSKTPPFSDKDLNEL